MVANCELPDGTRPDLSGANLALYLSEYSAEEPAVGQPVIISDPAPGVAEIQYEWSAGDSAAVGTFKFQVRGTLADGRPISFPNKGYKYLEVQPRV